mmetsp:Transcript_4953/g.10488  ORF Transcript_4953/g.10488 Transcript_4953/m.10488 type:complete len:136 (-) Transcript_4953:101-508(-)|eukprot:CAMPEP_0174708056 /NCGR_PEP_ID=MMETSP1094-20130205/10408_1 /TAXON_ID=156173 /ORGANISM="Chrysochromulina brevifilum, Strain UTEX LB 985" /LENGTH=135 /DNA_ID=CAMNT_0015906549 /DNA_START=270 /DNA_END=677 /DNA_ORIENTATION=-
MVSMVSSPSYGQGLCLHARLPFDQQQAPALLMCQDDAQDAKEHERPCESAHRFARFIFLVLLTQGLPLTAELPEHQPSKLAPSPLAHRYGAAGGGATLSHHQLKQRIFGEGGSRLSARTRGAWGEGPATQSDEDA